jgi:hypothetical protein
MKKDIKKALKALPGTYSITNRYVWWNILSFLLWLPMSGWVDSGGEPFNTGLYGCLGSASLNSSNYRWYYGWLDTGGKLGNYCNRRLAVSGLFRVQNSSLG